MGTLRLRRLSTFLALTASLAVLWPAPAQVFHSRESALQLAFPRADRITVRDLFLSGEQAADVVRLARVPLESRLVTVYVGWEGSELAGYAFFDTHTVRTLPETLLLVLDDHGRVRDTHLLAFHEPPEYLPPAGWLRRFAGRRLDDGLWISRAVDGITGSTLSARALTAAVRRLLAVYEVAIAPAPAATAAGGTP